MLWGTLTDMWKQLVSQTMVDTYESMLELFMAMNRCTTEWWLWFAMVCFLRPVNVEKLLFHMWEYSETFHKWNTQWNLVAYVQFVLNFKENLEIDGAVSIYSNDAKRNIQHNLSIFPFDRWQDTIFSLMRWKLWDISQRHRVIFSSHGYLAIFLFTLVGPSTNNNYNKKLHYTVINGNGITNTEMLKLLSLIFIHQYLYVIHSASKYFVGDLSCAAVSSLHAFWLVRKMRPPCS